MRILLLSLFFLTISGKSYSQNYDLIVTTEGDSIACFIDSITDSLIYIQLKFNEKWVHTWMKKSEISDYQMDVIDKKLFYFKEGTSTIESPVQVFISIKDIPKNSIYIESEIFSLSPFYERMFAIGNQVGITAGGGLWINIVGYDRDDWIVAKSALLLGETKHFFECGVLALYSLDGLSNKPIIPIIGYRYQRANGLLLRANALIVGGAIIILPGISIGYSF